MFPTIPVYSIVSQPFKRSQLGLFQGKTKQYGNNVPFSKHKTRRTWLPNVQRKRLFSDTMGEEVRVKLTTRALRTIKKVSSTIFMHRHAKQEELQHGGLDNYVENSSATILGWQGMRIRLKIREHGEQSSTTPTSAAAPISTIETNAEVPSAKVAVSVSEAKAKRQAKIKARAELRSIAESQPTMLDAQRVREMVMKTLGLETQPNARQTIAFLERHRKTLVKAAQFNVKTTL
ncbi:hypothetical protein D9615_002849 [Tricholomella constricta]|uniref:Large ribosomal subunit protein bL28c n=1 Tax=Tricholomella constricta TaxID=117010 RepID=A0A8H5HFQ6_9AGAR|nr:hypothetical protein D9615_002849 [Tricholomella constricta]